MSLYRQLVFAITLLIICLLAGNLFVSVFSARGSQFEQMQVHAQDAATSLGMSISHAAEQTDKAQIETFINALFDRGYFQSVSYQSFAGDVVIQKGVATAISDPIEVEGVPVWFVSLIDLPQPRGVAEVMSGWYRLGEVSVISHPGFAYQDLWRIFSEQLWLFVVSAVLCYGVAGIGLRYILRPLKRIEHQADAVCRREFPVQQQIPRTPELRSVVLAMNRMAKKLQLTFQQQVELSEVLHREAYLDEVTQLPNRRDFDARFESFLKSEQGGCPGVLLLLHLSGLSHLNDCSGRDQGDSCLREIAAVLSSYPWPSKSTILGRRSGADFSVFVPLFEEDEGRRLVDELMDRLGHCEFLSYTTELQLHVGVAFADAVMLGNSLLADADMALQQVKHQQAPKVSWIRSSSELKARSASDWKEMLSRTLQQKGFTFCLQPVFQLDAGIDSESAPASITHYEVLSRLHDQDELLAAGLFMPMAERFGLVAEIDRFTLEQLAEVKPVSNGTKLCVNLSPLTVADSGFCEWLRKFLSDHPQLASALILELPEYSLVTIEEQVRALGVTVKEYGTELSLDHFGVVASAFSYLQSLPLASLKIDRRFIHGIADSADNRFFVKSLLHIAHSCDVKLFAEGVETEQEWSLLVDLGIDGGQGYYLGSPSLSWQQESSKHESE